MMGPVPESTSHTGTERFERVLVYRGNVLDQVYRLTDPGEIVAERVFFVWTRVLGGPWERVTSYGQSSRIEGHERLSDLAAQRGGVGRFGYREIFSRKTSALHAWADRLPGMRVAIDIAESDLPR